MPANKETLSHHERRSKIGNVNYFAGAASAQSLAVRKWAFRLAASNYQTDCFVSICLYACGFMFRDRYFPALMPT